MAFSVFKIKPVIYFYVQFIRLELFCVRFNSLTERVMFSQVEKQEYSITKLYYPICELNQTCRLGMYIIFEGLINKQK